MAKVSAPNRGMGDHGVYKLVDVDFHLVIAETQPSHFDCVTQYHRPAPRAQFMADFVGDIRRIISAITQQAEADPVTGRFQYSLRAFQRLEPEVSIETTQRCDVTRGGGLRIHYENIGLNVSGRGLLEAALDSSPPECETFDPSVTGRGYAGFSGRVLIFLRLEARRFRGTEG